MTAKNDTRGREAPTARMEHTLLSHSLVQGIRVAAELGIADLLAKQPKNSDGLGDTTRAHGPSLFRLLRMLVSVGLFRQDANGRFYFTALGDTLRGGSSRSVRDLAILRGAPAFWQAA